MKTIVRVGSALLGVATLAAACGGEDLSVEGLAAGDVDSLSQPLCENIGGTNAVMTAIAVSAGKELRRWKPETDFTWNNSSGRLELTATGKARCGGSSGSSSSTCTDTPPDSTYTCAQQVGWGKCNESWMAGMCNASCGRCTSTSGGAGDCANTQAVLDMQKPEANGKVTFPGDIKLDTALLKSKLQAAWNDQKSCNDSGSCNVTAHDLKYTHVENGSCDKKFFFDPKKEGSSTWLSTTEADKLKNKLKFVGYPTNKMLNFYIRDGQVSVDPTYGLNEGVTTTSGSCDVACTKFSATNIAGACCSCNGATKKYTKSAFSAVMYLCNG